MGKLIVHIRSRRVNPARGVDVNLLPRDMTPPGQPGGIGYRGFEFEVSAGVNAEFKGTCALIYLPDSIDITRHTQQPE